MRYVLAIVLVGCAPSLIPAATSLAPIVTAAPTGTRGAGSPAEAATQLAKAAARPAAAATPAPSLALDERTQRLLARLRAMCEQREAEIPLDVVGALADGRDADALVAVLGRADGCQLMPSASGNGPDEVAVVGAYRATGALLWVDGGFWRVAPIPLDGGYLRILSDRRVHGTRELAFASWSGGTAGVRGFLVVAIDGATARIVLHTAFGGSHMGASLVSDDLFLVFGRNLPTRPWGISANCCLPGGYEWLWQWTSGGYALVAERQAQDPYFALNALLGALDAGALDLATDVATADVLATIPNMLGPGRLWTYKMPTNATAQSDAELYRWAALPARSTVTAEKVTYEVARYDPPGPSSLVTFERIGERWIATGIRPGRLP